MPITQRSPCFCHHDSNGRTVQLALRSFRNRWFLLRPECNDFPYWYVRGSRKLDAQEYSRLSELKSRIKRNREMRIPIMSKSWPKSEPQALRSTIKEFFIVRIDGAGLVFISKMLYSAKKKPMDSTSIGFDRQSVERFPDAKMTDIHIRRNYVGRYVR